MTARRNRIRVTKAILRRSGARHRKATRKRQPTWQRAALQVAGTILVLIGIAIGILTLRFGLVLMHGFLQ